MSPLPPAPAPPPAPAAAAPALHSRFSRGLVLLALGTGAMGLALGNTVMLALAASVAALLHAARAGWPGTGRVVLELPEQRVARGGTLPLTLRAQAQGGFVYWLHTALPATFTLEQGSNVALLDQGAAAERVLAGCPKRGAFPVGPATLTALHPHLLAPATPLAAVPAQEVAVEPRLHPLRRAKHPRGRARLQVGDDRAIRGPGGSEFLEVRPYQRGDPLRAVNWKATARRSASDLELMVNTREPEARRSVFFFLDMGEAMEVGTSLENALEDGVEAALALAHYFLARGHRVGGTTFNAPPMVFYPESGTRQQLTIARALARAEAGAGHEGLPAAVERVRGFLAREKPLMFVITRPELDPEGLAEGALRAQRYGARGKPQPILVMAPEPSAQAPGEALGRALQALEARAALGSSGVVRVVPLPHGARSLDVVLAKGVPAR